MSSYRIIDARGTQEGTDAFVHRLFPVPGGQRNLDPFVLWDHFTLQGGTGFPPHPHRGFEGVTYVLDGSMHHQDSLGNQSTVSAGGIQRFTAGKGIVHSETPAAMGETNGIQLWLNLAQADKSLKPDYQAVNPEQVHVTQGDGWQARQVLGQDSPVVLNTPADMRDIRLDAGASYQQNLTTPYQGLIYLMHGTIRIQLDGKEHELNPRQALLFGNTGNQFGQDVMYADRLKISTLQAARVIIASGLPHGEPIVQHGPFVD